MIIHNIHYHHYHQHYQKNKHYYNNNNNNNNIINNNKIFLQTIFQRQPAGQGKHATCVFRFIRIPRQRQCATRLHQPNGHERQRHLLPYP